MALTSLNPATGVALRSYREHTAPQLERAVDRATKAFKSWRQQSLAVRRRHLRALGRTLRSQAPRLALLITREMGKPIVQARAEIEKCAVACDYYAETGYRALQPEQPPGAPAGSQVVFEPLGILLAIMPWNFPFWQLFRAAAPALLAGNVVLLKHASNVSGCALAIERVVRAAGLPAGVLQTLLVRPERLAPLLAHPDIRAVTLTGSTQAGQQIGALAGAALKPTVFELGGSDPYLILDDADLPATAELCASARLVNSGQSCVAAKRFIVSRRVQAAFTRLFTERLAARIVGDPTRETTDVGPLAREDLRRDLHAQVTRSRRRGARLLLGGKLPAAPGFFYPATLLTEVSSGMPAYDEELFGPVAALITARDDEDAVAIANDTPYGLGAAIFTRRVARARALAPHLEAGVIAINGLVRSDVHLPFGGVKQSGYGRELGAFGLREFVNIKTIFVG